MTPPSLRQLVEGAARVLTEAGVPSPEHDARALAAFALGLPRLLPGFEPEPPADFAARFAALVERRRSREPLQRIVGSTSFRYLEVEVADDVFVPRPETELVAEQAIVEAVRLRAAGASPLVVDLCCGSGVIAVSVASEAPGARIVAVDAAPPAVAATRANARRAGVEVDARVGDVRDPLLLVDLGSRCDVVVANPPYIPPDAEPHDPEVRDHDPDLALYGGGTDGLDVPRAVVAAAVRLLRAGGLFVMEHAEVQAAAVRAELELTGAFEGVVTRPDLTGRDRMVVARRVAGAATGGAASAPDVEHSPS